MARLRRSDCSGPGYRRRRRGKGFEYLDWDSKPITDPWILDRITALVIPPAWTDVWICPDEQGHLQAIGVDGAGRKQYLYHPRWRDRQDQAKFERMLEFARALPAMRATTSEHLRLPGMPAERALACAVRLLDRGFFRVGGEAYARESGTVGLATIRKDQVRFEGRALVFEYVAKGGQDRMQSIVDPEVYEAVRALKRRRGGGDELLAFRADRRWRDVKSPDINDYIKAVTGGEFSAKDFRTWHASVLAAIALAVSVEASRSKTASKRAVSRAVQEVSHYLGNTPAVCRRSYIDPRVIDRYQAGVTISGALSVLGAAPSNGEPAFQQAVDQSVIDLIEDNSSKLVEKAA